MELKEKISKKNVSITKLEKEIAASHCGFLDAVFSIGINCIIQSYGKEDLMRLQREMGDELAPVQKLMDRMVYFGGLN